MAQFTPAEMAKKAKEIGFGGIDLTARPKGHVLPENAAADLPKAHDVIRSEGLSVPMITTDIKSAADPTARTILAGAGKLKIPYWKPGYHQYKNDDVDAMAKSVREAIVGMVALSKECGITAGWHNHSGNYFGQAIWDTRSVIQDLDPKWIGYYFDPAHATIEGGLGGWKTDMAVALPRLKMLAVKDFYWQKTNAGWKMTWCPLGEGMVNWKEVFARLAAAKFTGPLTLHVEYQPKDEVAAIAKDFEVLKKYVSEAYGS